MWAFVEATAMYREAAQLHQIRDKINPLIYYPIVVLFVFVVAWALPIFSVGYSFEHYRKWLLRKVRGHNHEN